MIVRGMTSRIDIAEIQKAALRSIPLTFRLTSLPHESHALLDRILEVYLEELGQEQILEPLSYCLKELIINAQKANTKRLYFEEKGLDIRSDEHYEQGMRDFRRESVERLEHWLGLLKESGLRDGVKVILGGGATSKDLAQKIGADAQTWDAYEGIRIIQSFVSAGSS